MIPTEYRKNVAVVVINVDGLMLACRRRDLPETWQIPQGGIDEGETPVEALFRELEEEIGTRDVSIVVRLPDPIRYEWPPELYARGFRGQEQIYFLVRLASSAVIELDRHHAPEFDKTEWLTSTEFLGRVHGFKSEAYRRGLETLSNLAPGTIR